MRPKGAEMQAPPPRHILFNNVLVTHSDFMTFGDFS